MNKKSKRLVDDPRLIEKRRPQIIEAAVYEFGRNGFHATTIRDIAERAGVSIGMIYQYVEDKDDLLYLAVKQFVQSSQVEIESSLQGVTDPFDRFLAAVGAIARVIDRGRAAAVMGYRESKVLRRDRLQEIMQTERVIASGITASAEACVAAGIFRPVDVQMLVYQCIVLAHNWPLNAWRFGRVMTVEEYMADGLRLLLGPVVSDETSLPTASRPRSAPG